MADNVVQVIIRARDEASRELEKFNSNLNAMAGALAGVAAASTALFLGLEKIAQSAAGRGEELGAVAQKTGTTVEQISRLQFAAIQSETSVEALSLGLRFLQKNAVDAGDKSSEAGKQFTAMGISVRDSGGQIRPTRDLLIDVADKFSKLRDGPEKAAAAIKIFGRSGTELIPLLNEGAAGIEALEKKADELGITVSETAAILGDRFGDKLSQLHLQIDGLKQKIATALLPTMIELADRIAPIIAKFGEWLQAHQALVTAIFILSGKVAVLASSLTALIGSLVAARLAAVAFGLSLGPVGIACTVIGIALAGLALNAEVARAKLKEPFQLGRFDLSSLESVKGALIQLGQEKDLAQKKLDELSQQKTATPLPAFRGREGLSQLPAIGKRAEIDDQITKQKLIIETIDSTVESLSRVEQAFQRAGSAGTGAGTKETEAAKKVREEWDKALRTVTETAEATTRSISEEVKTKDIKIGIGLDFKDPEQLAAFKARLQEVIDLGQEASRKKILLEAGVAGIEESGAELDRAIKKGEAFQKVLDQLSSKPVLVELQVPPLKIPESVGAGAGGGAQAFLENAGVSDEAIEKFTDHLIAAGKTGDSVFAGLDAGLLALAAQFEATGGVAGAVTDAIATGFLDIVDTSFKGVSGALGHLLDGTQNIGDAFESLAETVALAMGKIVIEIGLAIAKALVLRAILSVLPFLSEGGAVPALAGGGAVKRFAGGGRVEGPGSGTSDSVPIRASRGEFVVRESVASKPGILKHLEQLNAGGAIAKVIALASGGLIERTATSRDRLVERLERFSTGGLIRQAAAIAAGGVIALTALSHVQAAAPPSVTVGGARMTAILASGPLPAQAGLSVVPGAPQRHDSVLAALAPGEVVIPTIGGHSPASIPEDIGHLRSEVAALRQEIRSQGRGGDTFNINAFDIDVMRDLLRHGDLRREQLKAYDLGRA